MCDQLSQFVVEKYLHLENFLDKNDCLLFTSNLKKLVDQKVTSQDDQCQNSQSIHGAEIFDKLMLELLPSFEKITSKKLHPTYSYARLYYPGSELHNHIDRESCEISATITIGFDGDVWPIYMGDDIEKSNASQIKMNIGDAVLYRGTEKYHWREKYTEGNWQAQVFLHYVDADGPNADWIFDKRQGPVFTPERPEMRYRVFEDVLTAEDCDKFIAKYTKEDQIKLPPEIGTGFGSIDTAIRNVERVTLPTYKDLGAQLSAVGFSCNHFNWQFDITHASQAEFLIYPAGGRYQAHVDTFLSHGDDCRKLTVLAFLNNDFKGGKFFIQNGPNKIYPPQAKGNILVFPSFLMHGVEDIEEGMRYSAVCWMTGKFFK
jgi:predicted 2-oxoglutarate/Fe(II)-dependent dioxygenase YbiX